LRYHAFFQDLNDFCEASLLCFYYRSLPLSVLRRCVGALVDEELNHVLPSFCGSKMKRRIACVVLYVHIRAFGAAGVSCLRCALFLRIGIAGLLLVSALPLAVTARPLLITSRPLLITSRSLLITTLSLLITSRPLLVTSRPLLVAALPLLVAALPLLVASRPMLVAALPLLISALSLLITARPLLITALSLLVASRSLLHSSLPLLITSRSLLHTSLPLLITSRSLLHASRPLVHASRSLPVWSAIHEDSHNIEISLLARAVERSLAAVVLRIQRRSLLNQQQNGFPASFERGAVERRPAFIVFCVYIGAFLQKK